MGTKQAYRNSARMCKMHSFHAFNRILNYFPFTLREAILDCVFCMLTSDLGSGWGRGDKFSVLHPRFVESQLSSGFQGITSK